MARGDFKQRVEFELEDKASAGVGKIQGRFSKLGSFLKSSFVITLGDVVNVFKSLTGVVGSFIDAANVQEDAVKRLDVALSSLGPGADRVSKSLQAQAAALEATTKFGDEAIITNQALALTLGVQAKDMERVTLAAVELASATGISLESAFINLSKTFNGVRGELGELIPEMANLTEAELRAGAAADVVISRLGGSAAQQVGTFSGIVSQLANAWGTMQEKLGAAITENTAILDGMTRLRDVMTSQRFLKSVEDIAEGFSILAVDIANVTVAVVESVRHWKIWTDQLDKVFRGLQIVRNPMLAFRNDMRVTTEQSTFLGAAIDHLGSSLSAGAVSADTAAGAINDVAQANLTATVSTGLYDTAAEQAAEASKRLAEANHEAAAATKELTLQENLAENQSLTFEEAERRLRKETDALTVSLDRASGAASALNQATGGKLYARDRRNQADVDAALAFGRQPFLGGTRIRTDDGSGSRLVGRG